MVIVVTQPPKESPRPRSDLLHSCLIDCPSSKGNHAPHPKFERPNGKKHKIQKFFEIGPELLSPAQ